MKDRNILVGSIGLLSMEDVAFARFCLLQAIDEDKFAIGYEPGKRGVKHRIGIVMQEEDIEPVRKVVDTLRHFGIKVEDNLS